jgi:hypothetical protein
MFWCRTRMSHLGTKSLPAFALLVLVGTFAAGYAVAAGSGQPTPAEPEARLRELMTQRYELLQTMVKDSERRLENGRTDLLSHMILMTTLYGAEADLSTTITNRVKVHEMLVEALTPLLKDLQQLVAAGRLLRGDADKGKLVLLDAQVDLERLRLGQSPSQPWLRERYERRQ